MNKQISDMLPPPAIGIPIESSPVDKSDKSETEDSDIEDENGDVVITLFNGFDQGSVDKSTTMKSIPEESIADDSFYQKIEDGDFKVEPVNESDGSVYFRVQAPAFEEEYTEEQLLGIIAQLSNNLKRAERSARQQKSRRRSREQTIVKMAKILKGQKDTVDEQQAKVDELKSEIRMKETENALLDQRLRNTMKDLRDAESEIKSLSKRQHEQDAQNGDLQKQISLQAIDNEHAIRTRKQQRRVLKSIAITLLCVSSLTAVCAMFDCKMGNSKTMEVDKKCDMISSLGTRRHHVTSEGAESDGKRDRMNPSVLSQRRQRNLLAAAISESTTSSVVEHFIHGKQMH